jgi:hypothetical protein
MATIMMQSSTLVASLLLLACTAIAVKCPNSDEIVKLQVACCTQCYYYCRNSLPVMQVATAIAAAVKSAAW